MAWDQIGFTDNLLREDTQGQSQNQLDSLEFDKFVPEFSGSKLTGLLQSRDGRIKIDLDNGTIVVFDGAVERVRLGTLSDNSIGLLVKDVNGNVLMQISGNTNLIQSIDGNMVLDFNNKQLIVKDIGGTPRVIVGRISL